MTLPVSDVVQVTILVSPQAPVAQGFGVGLVLGVAAVLPLEERIRTYANLTGVAVDFNATTEEYKAAAAYFSQSPAPSKLKIGRRYTTAQAGKLKGGAVSAVYTDYTSITNGGFDISIDGANRAITTINCGSATSMADVATAIQTRLQAVLASTTCTWNGVQFVIGSPSTGPTSLVGFASAPTGGGSPTDQSTKFGFTLNAGALAVGGIAIETATSALDASLMFDKEWYGLALTAAASTQDQKDSAAWVEANKKAFFYTTNDPNAKLAVATSDLGYFFKNLGYNRTFGMYSNSPYAAVSAMARAFVVDFTQPNSTITLKFKQLPGIGADNITSSEKTALEGKNLNYYTSFGGFIMLANGAVANGRFFDEVHGLDWLEATVQNSIFTTLATTPTKIPQTDQGVARLVQAASQALKQAVSNGLLAPGVWLGDNVGETKYGDFLDKGFYLFAQAVSDQLPADRALRKSPPITGIGIGAGAIHSCSVQFTFQR